MYSIAGAHPIVARAIQAIAAGVLLAWGAFRLGGALFGPGAARWAAALVAAYPYFVHYGAALMTEAFIPSPLWSTISPPRSISAVGPSI